MTKNQKNQNGQKNQKGLASHEHQKEHKSKQEPKELWTMKIANQMESNSTQ